MDTSMIKGMAVGGIAMVVLGAGAEHHHRDAADCHSLDH